MKKEYKIIDRKVSKINLVILLFVYVMKISILTIVLGYIYNIGIYYQIYKFINILNFEVTLDIIFILIIFNLPQKTRVNKDIFKVYKKNVNFIIKKYFFIVEIIKDLMVVTILGEQIFYIKERWVSIIAIDIFIIIIYYFLNLLLIRENNTFLKFIKAKYEIKRYEKNPIDLNLNSRYQFIIIKGNQTQSMFSLENQEFIINSKHIYITQKEMETLTPNANKFINSNTIAIIFEYMNKDNIYNNVEDDIENSSERNNYYRIIGAPKEKIKEISEQIKNLKKLDTTRICDINSVVEYTEELFIISSDVEVKKRNYKWYKMMVDVELISVESSEESVKENSKIREIVDISEGKKDISYYRKLVEEEEDRLNIICQYNFNNRLKKKNYNMPNEKHLRELYRNAVINDSAYQSIMLLFNYNTYIGRIIETYLITKNRRDINLNEFNKVLATDRVSVWVGQILLNILIDENNFIFNNLRKREIRLNKEDRILLKLCLNKIINNEIVGKSITFDALATLYKEFRNRVEAHGIICEENVYIVWNLTMFFTDMFNRFFDLSNLHFEYKLSKGSYEILLGYDNEEKVSLGNVVTIKDNDIYFLKEIDKNESNS